MRKYAYHWYNYITGESGTQRIVCTFYGLLRMLNENNAKLGVRGLVYYTRETSAKEEGK